MSSDKTIARVRGMNDILPEHAPVWRFLEERTTALLDAYGYQQIRLPVIERTELFKRSIGEATDIVEKEMYTFEDRNGDSLTLRPEGTASCVRAGLGNNLLYNQKRRLWYGGPMFRREKPQAGRYRQFYQIGAEAFGFDGPDIDAELIALSANLWRALGLDGLVLELNTLGTPASRALYRARLVEYFTSHRDALDEDSVRRLSLNPLRILDTKNPAMADLVAGAPQLGDYLDPESAEHFDGVRRLLDATGIEYTLNPRLVRGLDYYTRTVFEWKSGALGAQNAVCSGGRYDGLVSQLGGKATPAVGWAMGLERLVELIGSSGVRIPSGAPHAYLVMVGDEAASAGFALAEELRQTVKDLRLTAHCGGGSFKAQLKKADASGAAVAIILGDDEVAAKTAGLKPLREKTPQTQVPWTDLADRLATLVTAGRDG